MSNKQQSEPKIKKQMNFTGLIIIGMLLIFVLALVIYIGDRNTKKNAAKMFKDAYIKINEFDELSNFYSKQEMEKEIIILLNRVLAKYSRTPSGKRALFYKGYIYYNTENYEKAEKTLKLFTNKFKKNYLAPKAYYILSYCYSDTDKIDDAIKTLEVFDDKLYDSYFTPLAYYRIGNLYETKGEKNNAIKYYKKITNEYSKSSQKEIANKKIILLENDIVL